MTVAGVTLLPRHVAYAVRRLLSAPTLRGHSSAKVSWGPRKVSAWCHLVPAVRGLAGERYRDAEEAINQVPECSRRGTRG